MQSLKKILEAISCGILAVATSVIVHWQAPIIQLINSILILTLLLIGFFKVVFKRIDTNNSNNKKSQKNAQNGQKNDNFAKKVVESQLPIRAIELSQNPTQVGEELGEMFLETMKGGKRKMEKFINFWKRVWGNKFTILNIAFNLFCVGVCEYLYFTDYFMRFSWVTENETILNIVLPIAGVIYLALDIFTTITKYGWENLEELKTKSAQKVLEKASQLTSEQKTAIKTQIKEVKSSLSAVGIDLNNVQEIIKNFETLQSLGSVVSISQDKVKLYQEALSKKPSLEANYSDLKLQLAQLQEALK